MRGSPASQADSQSLRAFKGIGPKLAEKLARLGLERTSDLVFHLPSRYQDRTHRQSIGSLHLHQEVLVAGRVVHAEIIRHRRPALLVRITDGTGILTLRFFHFQVAQYKQFTVDQAVQAFGEVRPGFSGLEMVHPEYHLLSSSEMAVGTVGETILTPIYPTTAGVNQSILRRLIRQVIRHYSPEEWLPMTSLPQDLRLGLSQALNFLHAPPPGVDLDALAAGRHPAQRRLAFEELIAHQLGLARLRAQTRQIPAPHLPTPGLRAGLLLKRLPFSLTTAQQRVVREINADLALDQPMLRLVQGDVGSGKTVVALLACLQALDGQYQAAIMAPTELLADQHYQNAIRWLGPLGIRIGWIGGRQTTTERKAVLAGIANGEVNMVVGTHALFQDKVEFSALGLIVIDEQHRFGVHQRLALREKGRANSLQPHQLVMTATPIPRTLAMTAYADLDYSVIDELPPGRIPITTVAIPEMRRSEVIERIHQAVAAGRQAYWVCTLIEESEVLQGENAEATYALLRQQLPGLRIELAHGRLKGGEKALAMQSFAQGKIDLLVATTVIEVGVDVPNASLMVIENAERLGLAQLHQLRGRIGRGETASSCVLLYHPPLGEIAKKRLQVLRETNDGFEIARRDLEIRGPGELLGVRQTGLTHFRVADLNRDTDLLPAAHKAARQLWAENPAAAKALIQRWLAGAEHYARV